MEIEPSRKKQLKDTIRYQLHAILYGITKNAYYLYEIKNTSSFPDEQDRKRNVGRFHHIDIPRITQLSQLSGFDSNKIYLLVNGEQIQDKKIWKVISLTRVHNDYVIFSWDPVTKPDIQYFWIQHNQEKNEIPLEFDKTTLHQALNISMAELDYDGISDIFDEFDPNDTQFEQIMNTLTPDNKTKVMSIFLTDQQITDIEQSHMPSEHIQEPIPEKNRTTTTTNKTTS